MRRTTKDTLPRQTVIKRRRDAGDAGHPDSSDPGLIASETCCQAPALDPSPEPEEPEQMEPWPWLATQFYGVIELNPTRVGRDVEQIAEKVIALLAGMAGASITITLEIAAEIPDGVPEDVERKIIGNCYKLKFREKRFDVK